MDNIKKNDVDEKLFFDTLTNVQFLGYEPSKKVDGSPWVCMLFTNSLIDTKGLFTKTEAIITDCYMKLPFTPVANKLYKVVAQIPRFSDGWVIPKIKEFIKE